ncbi:MAG TPA: hypothetical protein VLA72_07290, partial [Anaerolineales bacterium]|nr:hypothetical protein [Anaerolineales bacterium]
MSAGVARVARVVKDKRVLKLMRAYLESGVMVNGVVMETAEGTPQGGPLPPRRVRWREHQPRRVRVRSNADHVARIVGPGERVQLVAAGGVG